MAPWMEKYTFILLLSHMGYLDIRGLESERSQFSNHSSSCQHILMTCQSIFMPNPEGNLWVPIDETSSLPEGF